MQQHQQRRHPNQAQHQHRQLLLAQLASHASKYSPQTALFYTERLHALDPSVEYSVYSLASLLFALNRKNEALHALRQPVVAPLADSDNNNPFAPTQRTTARWNGANRSLKPANESTLRCARLYANCCLDLGREKEGRDVLAKAISNALPVPSPTPLPPLDPAAMANPPFCFDNPAEPWILELEMARLATQSGEHERAIQSYRKVLEANAWCWEAIEGLCIEGAPPDADVLFPPRARIPPPNINVPLATSQPARPVPLTFTLLPANPHPPPLGPSQNFAVNSVGMQRPPKGATRGQGGAGSSGDGMQYLTPSEVANPAANGKDKGKGVFGLGAGGGIGMNLWKNRLPGARNVTDVVEMSIDESTFSFDNSFYPSQQNPPLNANAHASTSESLFTPPTTTTTSAVVPGVKRARGQTQAGSSTTSSTTYRASAGEEDPKGTRRVVRGVPGGGDKTSRGREVVPVAPTRRSARISKELSASSTLPTSSSASSVMTTSRSQQSVSSRNGSITTTGPTTRDKKRSKAGAGPSVLSDAGSDIISPTSHSSSPGPSSPPISQHAQLNPMFVVVDPAVQEAEEYVVGVVRTFARAAACSATYESAKAIEALLTLPVEQQRSWRCLIAVARAHMEMLNYDKAEKAFAQARQLAPHLLDSMELYSTILWHLRLPTLLSFLAQDLMAIAPSSPCAWIASGNVFSHLEDHAAALKCFKRAAQLDEKCVYAYTLSGHECVVLEEWERALSFFREAVRRDKRHYNAWFGLGNVYMQTGKFRLAEYHFRKAAEINPSNATLVCCVGSVLEKQGRRKSALVMYERACVLAPESPAVRFKRVRILLSLRQYKVAEVDLLNLKDRAPNEFNVHFLLGKLYKVLHREAEMLKHLGCAQDLEPRSASMIRDLISRGSEEVNLMEVDEEEAEGWDEGAEGLT